MGPRTAASSFLPGKHAREPVPSANRRRRRSRCHADRLPPNRPAGPHRRTAAGRIAPRRTPGAWAGLFAALLAAATLTAAPACAQAWHYAGGEAGLKVNGRFVGLSFYCTGGGAIRLVFSGFPGKLQAGQPYTTVVTVDGTSFLFEPKAEDGEAFRSILVDRRTVAESAGFIDALQKGHEAEVSGPAGLYVVPLKGSSRRAGDAAQELRLSRPHLRRNCARRDGRCRGRPDQRP